MVIYDEKQQEIAEKINPKSRISNWKDWKWQLKNSIKDISTFEKLTGIRFEKNERNLLEKTIEKFPLSITPYYLSLIDAADYKNDP
ncbi:MAG TPA: lysine 2,3-aminomutase, partial [Candidatus Methanoperedens sp.]|nr:lysine 2,3-aminomutase [Candidatus Methanoperedens sp.]